MNWIDLKDEMPKEYKLVLVTVGFKAKVISAYLERGRFYSVIDDFMLNKTVSHWMPFPKPAR